jgi:hypothetical protein
MHWGGVDNKHRQRRTFEWIERNADEISAKLSNAVNLIKDERASLDSFDGVNLIMNSTMTKIVSLADPEQKLVICESLIRPHISLTQCRVVDSRNTQNCRFRTRRIGRSPDFRHRPREMAVRQAGTETVQ